MAEESDYSSIGPLDAAAQKDAMPLIGMFLLAMVITVVAVYVIGMIADALG